jgi:glutamyl/glutaminyl-tRNA synthetase
MRDIITRFAPAPTGFLHLGHIVNAIHVWGAARAHGGRVLLRIEDHDRQRSRAAYQRAILDDLAWLGFVADGPPVRQSERDAIYQRALDGLRAKGVIYVCRCSRAEIAAGLEPCATTNDLGAQPFRAATELRYPGTCRDRGVVECPGASLRVRLDRSVERFEDLRHGWIEQIPSEQCGDVVVRNREGNWTYQFAVTVDDMEQAVTLVIRGDDLLESTGRQIQLARLLGRSDPPRFLHHALIMKSGTAGGYGAPRPQKLSKSDGDTGVRDLRAAGWTPQRVLGHAAFMAGLTTESIALSVADLPSLLPPLPFR